MKLSNRQIIESVKVLSKLTVMDLNIKVSYAVAKNIKKIDKEINFYNEERAKLIDKYSVKDEEGNIKTNEDGTISLKEECLNEWNNDSNELLNIENDIDIHLIDPYDLEKCNCNITPGELMIIDYMFK